MLSDLNRVDFHNVQEQAAWVCQCDTAAVQQMEQEFKAALQHANSLEQWAAWLQQVVERTLRTLRNKGESQFAHAARQFLLKWSFYSSMVIRDLTLRSAASFGSFHLIRLLYDEYMYYIVEHQVAEATHIPPIAVMRMGRKDGGVICGAMERSTVLVAGAAVLDVNGGESRHAVVSMNYIATYISTF